jgi:ABC-type amino acid transport substrate-binding protein
MSGRRNMKQKQATIKRARWGALLAALSLCWATASHAATHIVYPLTGGGIDSRYDYDWAVLRTALQKTEARYGGFELKQSDIVMSPQRVAQELSMPAGRINILVRATNPRLEMDFIPVRLPVDRGLLGYRVFLVRRADLPRFAQVRTLDDLRKLRAGQGKDWADIAILKAAGIETEEGTSYDGLFAMLDAGRFDFFSRAADEARREFGERHARHPQLAVEPTLLLHYPLPRYFFLRRDDEGRNLAARIAAGMEIMIKDGSLNALFERYKHRIIEQSGLRKRRVLSIPNPTLSPETPLSRSELWYDPLSGN